MYRSPRGLRGNTGIDGTASKKVNHIEINIDKDPMIDYDFLKFTIYFDDNTSFSLTCNNLYPYLKSVQNILHTEALTQRFLTEQTLNNLSITTSSSQVAIEGSYGYAFIVEPTYENSTDFSSNINVVSSNTNSRAASNVLNPSSSGTMFTISNSSNPQLGVILNKSATVIDDWNFTNTTSNLQIPFKFSDITKRHYGGFCFTNTVEVFSQTLNVIVDPDISNRPPQLINEYLKNCDRYVDQYISFVIPPLPLGNIRIIIRQGSNTIINQLYTHDGIYKTLIYRFDQQFIEKDQEFIPITVIVTRNLENMNWGLVDINYFCIMYTACEF